MTVTSSEKQKREEVFCRTGLGRSKLWEVSVELPAVTCGLHGSYMTVFLPENSRFYRVLTVKSGGNPQLCRL